MSKLRIPEHLRKWIDARRRFGLSHAQVQMARELGMNPKKFGSLANHTQQPWKAPLPQFIEDLYLRRFGKERPDRVMSIEERAAELAAKKVERRARREAERAQAQGPLGTTPDVPRYTFEEPEQDHGEREAPF